MIADYKRISATDIYLCQVVVVNFFPDPERVLLLAKFITVTNCGKVIHVFSRFQFVC